MRYYVIITTIYNEIGTKSFSSETKNHKKEIGIIGVIEKIL